VIRAAAHPATRCALAITALLPGINLRDITFEEENKRGSLQLVAEHGMKAGYVRNIERDPRVRLKLREGFRTRWHTGTAHLLPDDDPRERQRWLASQLPISAGNARAVRLFGTQLLSIRIDLDC
jgi:F420H(2)-dependent quinone reductase